MYIEFGNEATESGNMHMNCVGVQNTKFNKQFQKGSKSVLQCKLSFCSYQMFLS